MEFFLKQHVFNQHTLANYSDLSRKVIFQSKLNQNVVLAKANPTSKACEKFLENSTLEFKLDLIPELINVLRVARPGVGANFFVIGSYENYKKDEIRLILRDSSYAGFEILQQKKTTTLDEEDMEFSDDPDPVDIGTSSTQPEDK